MVIGSCSVLSAISAATLSAPADFLKTRLMLDKNRVQYSGIFNAIFKVNAFFDSDCHG